jgi:hypothetical protein
MRGICAALWCLALLVSVTIQASAADPRRVLRAGRSLHSYPAARSDGPCSARRLPTRSASRRIPNDEGRTREPRSRSEDRGRNWKAARTSSRGRQPRRLARRPTRSTKAAIPSGAPSTGLPRFEMSPWFLIGAAVISLALLLGLVAGVPGAIANCKPTSGSDWMLCCLQCSTTPARLANGAARGPAAAVCSHNRPVLQEAPVSSQTPASFLSVRQLLPPGMLPLWPACRCRAAIPARRALSGPACVGG